MSSNTPEYINNALNALSKVVESDTEVATIDLSLLENLNTNQSLNYIKLEQKLNVLETSSSDIQRLDDEYKSYASMLDSIEQKIGTLEQLAGELDSWSKELKQAASK